VTRGKRTDTKSRVVFSFYVSDLVWSAPAVRSKIC